MSLTKRAKLLASTMFIGAASLMSAMPQKHKTHKPMSQRRLFKTQPKRPHGKILVIFSATLVMESPWCRMDV